MKDQESKPNINFRIKGYEELKNDGKGYYKTKQVDDLTTAIVYCKSFNGAIVAGKTGVGKTSIIQQFARQNLAQMFNVTSIKVINIFWDTLKSLQSENGWLELVKRIHNEYFNSSIILYAKVEDKNLIEGIIRFCNKYFEETQKAFNIPVFKVILEVTIEKEGQMECFNNILNNRFMLIPVYGVDSFTKKMNYIDQIAKNISKSYGIEISYSMAFYAATVIKGYFNEDDNLYLYNIGFEKLFAVATKMKMQSITEGVVEEAYSEWFEKLFNRCSEYSYQVAIHESGHTLITMLLKNYRNMEYVSIVPGNGYNAVTEFSKLEKCSEYAVLDRQWFIMCIASKLAGREAERLIKGKENDNTSAEFDLQSANELVLDMIKKQGISNNLGYNVVIGSKEQISENLQIQIEHEKAKIIQEAAFFAYIKVQKHQSFIKELADCLIKQKVVPGNQVRKLWEKHLQEINKAVEE